MLELTCRGARWQDGQHVLEYGIKWVCRACGETSRMPRGYHHDQPSGACPAPTKALLTQVA